MKKIILVIALMVGYMSQTDAQIKFGLKAGLNFDKFSPKNARQDLKFKNSTGWQAGALLKINVPVIGIGVQPELLYTVKKTNVDSKSNSIHYFEIPVNLRWELNLLLIKPFLMGGPYFGYAVNTTGKVFNADDANIDKTDWGIGLGGGVEVWKLQLGARYSWGLQDVAVKDFKIRNNTFSASVAYFF